MDELEALEMSLLNFNLIIYIIHKMLVLLKHHLNYLKDGIFEHFFNEYNRLLFSLYKVILYTLSNDGKFKC